MKARRIFVLALVLVLSGMTAAVAGSKQEAAGTDGIAQALEKIKEGTMFRASVSMAPYESGRQEMEILWKLISGEPCEPHQKIANEAITVANVDKYLN